MGPGRAAPVVPLLAAALAAAGCASVAVVADPEPVPEGKVRGGVGLGGYVEGGGGFRGWLVPQVDARFGLGSGFDLGARLTPLELSIDVKGLVHEKEGTAAAVGAGGGVGADPVMATSGTRSFWANGRAYAIVRWRRGKLSVYGGPQIVFGPAFTGAELEDPWLHFRGGAFAGIGVTAKPEKTPELFLFFELQAGFTHWQPVVRGVDGRVARTGGYFTPTFALAWNWFAPGALW